MAGRNVSNCPRLRGERHQLRGAAGHHGGIVRAVNNNASQRQPSAHDLLERGVVELAQVLGPAEFEFIETDDGATNGGTFASGEFLRADRRLELHVRSSLVLVRYHFDDESLSHEELVRGVRALDGIAAEGQYPGFSTDPMAGFRHLRHDLDRFGAIFLRGGAKAFRALKKWVNKHPKKSGLAGLGP
jgi:hypothetical protein